MSKLIDKWAETFIKSIISHLGPRSKDIVENEVQKNFNNVVKSYLTERKKDINTELNKVTNRAKNYEQSFQKHSKTITKKYLDKQLKKKAGQLDEEITKILGKESVDLATFSTQELTSIEKKLANTYENWLLNKIPDFCTQFYKKITENFTRIPKGRCVEFEIERKILTEKYRKKLIEMVNSSKNIKTKALNQQIKKTKEEEDKFFPKIEKLWKDEYQKKQKELGNELTSTFTTFEKDSSSEALEQAIQKLEEAGKNIKKGIDLWANSLYEKAKELPYPQSKRSLNENEKFKKDYTRKLKKEVESKLQKIKSGIAQDLKKVKQEEEEKNKSSGNGNIIAYPVVSIVVIPTAIYVIWKKLSTKSYL